jgi:hypothetical protein
MPKKELSTPADKAVRSPQLPPLMWMFARWTVILCAVSFCFHLFYHFVFHFHGYPSYPFTEPNWYRFADFWIFQDKFKYFHTPTFFQVGFPINYPAPVAVIFEFFFKYFAPHPTAAFETFIVLSLAIPAILFARALTLFGVATRQAWLFAAIVWPLSWPVLLIIDGGNAEVLVWVALAVAMWAYATGRGWLAAVFFGFAASLKLFPFVFLALFLSRRQFPKLIAGVISFFVISLVSLKILGPTVAMAYQGLATNLNSFRVTYMAQWHTVENGVDHSLFCFIKFVAMLLHHNSGTFLSWLDVYLLLTSVIGTLAYFLYIRKLPLLNQVLILTIVSIYLTAFSGDGTLIHLYYPLAMIFLLSIQAWRDNVRIPGLALIFGCMVFCLSIESFFVIPRPDKIGIRFIGEMHCIGLTVLLYAALRYRLGPPLSEQSDPIVLSKPVTGWVKEAPTS